MRGGQKKINFRTTEEQDEHLRMVAKHAKMPVSEVIRRALDVFLKAYLKRMSEKRGVKNGR